MSKVLSMVKALWIPINSRDAEQVCLLLPEFTKRNIDTKIATQDAYTKEECEVYLSREGIPFETILNYRTHNTLEILNKEKPDIILLNSDYGMVERCFTYAANRIQIPTLMIQSGSIPNSRRDVRGGIIRVLGINRRKGLLALYKRYKFLFSNLLNIETNPLIALKKFVREVITGVMYMDRRGYYASKIAATGFYDKELMIQNGADEKRIVITGNPRFDKIVDNRDGYMNKSKICDIFAIPETNRIILLLTPCLVPQGIWNEGKRREFSHSVLEAFKAIKNSDSRLTLIVKVHPLEEIADYEKYLESNEERTDEVILCKDVDVYGLIGASDLVISAYSTTILEAAIMNKPVILLNLFNDPEYAPYVSEGAAVGVYNKVGLLQEMRKGLYDEGARDKLSKARDECVYKHAYVQDGKASERIADLIIQMVS